MVLGVSSVGNVIAILAVFIGPIVGAVIALSVQRQTISTARAEDARDRAQAHRERTYEQALDYIYRLERFAHANFPSFDHPTKTDPSKILRWPDVTTEEEARQVAVRLRLFGSQTTQDLFERFRSAFLDGRGKSIQWVGDITHEADPSAEHFDQVKSSWDELDKALRGVSNAVKDIEKAMAEELGE